MTRTSRSQLGLLIVDHGTRSAAANAPLAAFARRIADARPTWFVEHAHMELAEPDFDTAIDRLILRGASEVLIHLHFLGVGFHVRETIPELVQIARKRYPTVLIETTTPLGDDSRLVEIVLDRMDAHRVEDRQS